MNEITQAYLKILLSWQAISLILVLIFRKPITQLLTSITHGFEAKFAGFTLKVPPIEIKEEATGETTKVASITIPQGIETGLNQIHINILKEFYEKGDYDTLKVSKNLITQFRKLRELGLLGWKSENKENEFYILKEFILTEAAKKYIESIN